MEKKTIFVFVIFSTCLPSSGQSKFTDIYNYVGQKLKLKCNIPTKYKNCSSKLLMFQKERPFQINTEISYEAISNTFVKYNSSSSAALEYPNASINHTGTYHCVLNFCVDQNITIKQFDVKIQYQPVNVSNFTCQLIDWDKYLFCSWKHPVQYNWELNDTKIEFHYKTDGPSNAIWACSNLTINNCTLTKYGGSNYYDFEIFVNNTKTNYYSCSKYVIKTYQVVKPSAVKSMNFTESTKNNCFNVSWIFEDFPVNKKFELRHKGPYDTEFKVSHFNQNTWKEVCNMKPYTKHNFTVICHALTSNLTSDPIYFFFETPQKAPTLGPQAVNGSYTTDQCKNNIRSVTLYWKRVETNARNGNITGYIVRHGNIARPVGPNTYQTSIEMPCYTTEFIEIAAATKIGQSVKPTVLSIAPIHFKVPSSVAESLAIEETSYLATWKHDEAKYCVAYTIFWFDDPLDGYHGKQLFWKHLEHKQNSFLIPYNQSDIKVGIACTHNTTSPIFWTECIYNVNAPLDAPTFEVIVTKESVTVTWEKMPCSIKYKYKVTSYVVVYCLVTECQDPTNVSTPSSSTYYTLENLQVDSSYKISMYVQVGNRTGPLSQWKTFMTHEYRNDENSILEITVPLVLSSIVLLLIFPVFRCIRLNRRARQKTKKLMNTEEDSTTDLIPEHSSGEDNKSLRSIGHHNPQIDVSKPLLLSLHALKHEGLMSEESQPSLVENLLNSINPPTSSIATADPTPSYSVISSTSFDRIQQWENGEKELEKRQKLTNFFMRDLETNVKPSCKEYEQFDIIKCIMSSDSGRHGVTGHQTLKDSDSGKHGVTGHQTLKDSDSGRHGVTGHLTGSKKLKDSDSGRHGVTGHQTGSSTDEKLKDSIRFGVYDDCPTQHYEIRNEKDIMESSQFTPEKFDFSDASCVSLTFGQSCVSVELEVQSLPKADICHADACKDYVTITEQGILLSQTSTDSECTNGDTCNAFFETDTPETRPLNHAASSIDCTDYMRQTEFTLRKPFSEHIENNMNSDPVNTRVTVMAALNKQNSAVNLIKHTPPVNKINQ